MKIKAGETRYLVRKIETEKSYDNVRFRLTNKKNTIEKSTDTDQAKDKVIVQDGVFLIPLQQQDTVDLVGSVTIEAEIDYQDKSVRYTDYNALYVNESLGWEQITGSKPSDDDGIEPVMEAIEQGIYVIVGPESSQELINAVTELFQDTKQIAQSVRDDADNGEFDGYSPQVTVKTETPSTYVLHIKDADHEYDTPNLKGSGGGGGTYSGVGHITVEGDEISTEANKVYPAKFVNNEIDLREASYPNIQRFDLLMDMTNQRFFYCEYLNEIGNIQGHWIEKVKSIIGTPPATVNVSQDPLAELFVDDVLLSDNGNIYRVLTKDLSSLPDIAYTYQTYGVDLSNYDTSAQVDAKILNKTNKIWNAVYRNGELSRERSDYDGIKVRDLIIDYQGRRKIYEVYMLPSSTNAISLREMSNVYAISGTPPTVSTDASDGEIYFKDCVYFSDNGNIYYCIDRDDSQAPSQFTFTWQVYRPLPSSAQADSGKFLRVNANGEAEWQTINNASGRSF